MLDRFPGVRGTAPRALSSNHPVRLSRPRSRAPARRRAARGCARPSPAPRPAAGREARHDERDAKLSSMPTAPMPSGEMPNHQCSAVFAAGFDELEVDDVRRRERDAGDHPGDRALAVHPLREDAEDDDREERRRGEAEGERHDLGDEAGRIDAEVAGDATARRRRRARRSARRARDRGRRLRFSRSWLTAVEITSSSPAAVDSAAASPPAATSPTTQFGSPAISGFASTMMSRSTSARCAPVRPPRPPRGPTNCTRRRRCGPRSGSAPSAPTCGTTPASRRTAGPPPCRSRFVRANAATAGADV
jgi:hypothetical protein